MTADWSANAIAETLPLPTFQRLIFSAVQLKMRPDRLANAQT
jgi:hypothetical protein